jgi:hypothetical protein
MNVTFTRTGERRYGVWVEGLGVVSSHMSPAAGYDDRLPHDMAHFVVENDLAIMGGVFGQLASGGHAHSFQPDVEQKNSRAAKRGDRVSAESRKDAEMSERVIDIACHAWTKRKYTGALVKGVTAEDIARICREFDSVSGIWSKLKVGESMTLKWTAKPKRPR